MKVEIIRQEYSDKQTLGSLYILNDSGKAIYTCKTLELEEEENAQRDDCIPKGEYEVVKRNSPKYGDHFHVLNVPNRSMILIHNANYHRQLLGCIAVGKQHADIDGDGYRDVTSSKFTMAELNKILPNRFKLLVK